MRSIQWWRLSETYSDSSAFRHCRVKSSASSKEIWTTTVLKNHLRFTESGHDKNPCTKTKWQILPRSMTSSHHASSVQVISDHRSPLAQGGTITSSTLTPSVLTPRSRFCIAQREGKNSYTNFYLYVRMYVCVCMCVCVCIHSQEPTNMFSKKSPGGW